MTNNNVLRSLRYTFDFSDPKMIAIFKSGGCETSREQVKGWLEKEEAPGYLECTDINMAMFLNGWIIDRRGKKEGPQPEPEIRLNNNIIFRKIKIALDLKADVVLKIMTMAGLPMSKPELSAFFRKPGHKNYRACQDQILRNFLKGVQLAYRSEAK